MNNFKKYLKATKTKDIYSTVSNKDIEKIKNAKTDEEAMEIALTYFKDPDDAENFVNSVRK